MKKIIICIITIMLVAPCIMAQTTPQGMKYQAIARDLNGEIMPDQPIELRMTLRSNDNTTMDHYIETHSAITNKLGLFSLVIGRGDVQLGTFKDIPWSEENIWISIEIKNQDTNAFTVISNSKLLAVPYAFHANTASNLAPTDSDFSMENRVDGIRSQTWSLFGNLYSDDKIDKLGTSDYMGLNIVTNDTQRIRITADGSTINNGDFTVANSSSTTLTGTLDVDLDGTFGENVHVTDTLYANTGMFEKNVHVGDTLFAETVKTAGLDIKANKPDGEYLATFENINTGDGDGLLIKLGKDRTNLTIPAISPDLAGLASIKNLVSCDIDINAKIGQLGSIALAEITADIEMVAGLSVGITNIIIDMLNGVFDIIVPTIPAICIDINPVDPPINVCLPEPFDTPTDIIPDIPEVDLTDIGLLVGLNLSEIPLDSPDFWGIPSLCLTDDPGTTPLNNENEFITFADHSGTKMGSIRAVSVTNWSDNYLTPAFLFTLKGALTSSALDKKHARYHFKKEINKAVKDYIAIGVEYSSGNGDYAEWLERLDPKERISTGDIVGVKGGKITKDLTHAEQVMAVSHRPIVLGNIPEEGRAYLGNNIAFMGQIPVKVMGPVATGDYIVGNGEIKGYGVAISPNDMTLEDFKYAVGRSWDANEESGPIMVNTVVGVHNGDYLNILKRYETKFKASEERLESVEAKIDLLSSKLLPAE